MAGRDEYAPWRSLAPMDDRGEPRSAVEARIGLVLGVAAALPCLIYLSNFTVDDALIPARYATHLARGLGYRFNAHGPSTDGVTPLGWAHLLAPFAARGPLSALAAARVLGSVSWLLAAGALGHAIATVRGSSARYAALGLVLLSAPLGAWAAAGLETGVVMALATLAAVIPPRPAWSGLGGALAGASAWLRPEMIVHALVLCGGRARLADSTRAKCATWALGLGPWCLVALVRSIVWGRPAPLAILAKPSDLAHGLRYVLPALVLTGAPWVAMAPLGFRRLELWPRVLVVAGFAHLLVVILCGGDWMPLARLVCPVLPGLIYVASHLLGTTSSRKSAMARLVVAFAAQVFLLIWRGPAAARVLPDRLSLIRAARPVLANATRVATVDIGWVGAATEAEIVDLAGATSPEIAALPGGHTSKAISGSFLTGQRPDYLVFQMLPEAGPPIFYARTVERRLASDPLVARNYALVWTSPTDLPTRYAVLSIDRGEAP